MTARACVLVLVIAATGACKRSRSVSSVSDDARSESPPSAPFDAGAAASMPERIIIDQVELRTVEPRDGRERELYPRELAKQLGRQLAQSPFFVADAGDVPLGHRGRLATVDVSIGYDFVDSPERGGRVMVAAIESRVAWKEPGATDLAPAANVLAERLLTPGEREREDSLLAAFVAEALMQIGHGLVAKEQVRTGGVEGIAQALAGSDPDNVLFALDLVAERRQVELLDAVVATLASPEPTIRNRSLGTLVELGDARAVDALAKRAAFGDHELMRMVIEAVSALGGEDAREYLEFVASGHPDETLRELARDGLERVQRAGR